MFKKEFPIHELKWSLLRFKYNLELISYISIDVTCEVQVYSISSNFLTVTDAPPTKIFLISCSFWENPANLYVGAPQKLASPPMGNSVSTCDLLVRTC